MVGDALEARRAADVGDVDDHDADDLAEAECCDGEVVAAQTQCRQTDECAEESRRDAAYEVVAGMLRNSLHWADGGHTPANLEITESADYRALVPQSHYAGAIDQAVFEPAAWFTGSGSDFQARVAEVMQACWLSGSSTPEQAVDGLIDRFNTMLAQNPPA